MGLKWREGGGENLASVAMRSSSCALEWIPNGLQRIGGREIDIQNHYEKERNAEVEIETETRMERWMNEWDG